MELPEVQEYDQVAWLDSDIIINPTAPNIFDEVPVERIGGVKGFDQLYQNSQDVFTEDVLNYIKTPYRNAKEWYRLNNLIPEYDEVLQTGVMILSPKYHNDFLKNIFFTGQDSKTGDYEMPSLSHGALKNELIYWIDDRFNMLWTGLMCHKYRECLPPKTQVFPIRQFKKITRGHYQFPNRGLLKTSLVSAFKESYFLHFAGNAHFMGAIDFNKV